MLAAALLVLALVSGSALFCVRSKTTGSPAGPEAGGHNGNPSARAVPKGDGAGNKALPKGSGPVYMTQEQQDSRQHLWGKPNLPEVEKARRNGAKAKVTLRVIDSCGAPVPEANIQVAFFPQDAYEAAKITKGLTDKEGLFSVSGKTVDDLSFTVSKTNHYVTSRAFHFYWRGTECVKGGRWQPWNPMLEVVLKEKRNPVPMLFTGETKVVVPKGMTIGFDCIKKSLLAPYGIGEVADFMLTYSSNGKDRLNLEKRMTMLFPEGCGLIKLPKETFSQFPSLHEAPENGYQQEMTFEFFRTPTAILKDEGLQDTEYVIMRSRMKKDDGGKIVSATYGKFYRLAFDESDDGKTGYLLLQYCINPTPNDHNLEAEGRYP